MNIDRFKRVSCYEELEMLMVIGGMYEMRREVFIKLSNYQDDNAFCIPTVSGFVWFSKRSLKRIEAPQEVGGDFYCSDCTSLTSLEGAPQEVGGDFDCSGCFSLTSLEGAPRKVGECFRCYDCSFLTSLEIERLKKSRNYKIVSQLI